MSWMYDDITKIYDKHPETKLWIFINGCGGNVFSVAGYLKYLWDNYSIDIRTGKIGFVTISASGFPVLSLRCEDKSIFLADCFHTFFHYNTCSQKGFDNIFEEGEDFLLNHFVNTYVFQKYSKTQNFKHIVITTSIAQNTTHKLDWYYHDLSVNSNVPDDVYAKTILASAYLGFLDPATNWKGLKIGDLYHGDGTEWGTPPENTLDLYESMGVTCISIKFAWNAFWGLTFMRRTTAYRWYEKGYNDISKSLKDSSSKLSEEFNDKDIFPRGDPTQPKQDESINFRVLHLSDSYHSRAYMAMSFFNPSKLARDISFLIKLVRNNWVHVPKMTVFKGFITYE